MNQTMNDMCKKDLPNLHEWCEAYAKKTGIKVYAGNPPVALILEHHIGVLKKHINDTQEAIANLRAEIQKLLPTEEPKTEEKKPRGKK